VSAIIGIDLGTTFSAVAQLDATGRPSIVHNADGSNITPSVVAFTGHNRFEVGEEARKLLFLDTNTFGRFKREMGRDKTYTSNWGRHTPTELSAMVLKKLKNDTEKMIGPVREAVVTIPANFANEAREATMEAAKAAGLQIKYIINEPTAAALYFAHYKGEQLGGVYAVYDLGGGTFDITIVRISGEDIQVLGTEGVSKLGGDDIDQKLQELIARKYLDETGGALEVNDYTRNDAEEDKKSLSRRDRVITRVTGKSGRANITIDRSEFEEAISALLAQTEMLCEAALDEAGVKPSDVREIILAGGSTRIPAVQRSVARVFGREPSTFANPDEVVALGAALYAAYKTDRANLNPIQASSVAKIKVAEITSKCFGTLTVDYNSVRSEAELKNSIIIAKGTQIPASVTEQFYTIADDQRSVDCSVTEANTAESDPRFVKIVWQGELTLPPGRPANQEIQVTYSYDVNQTMRCSFRDVATDAVTEVDLSMGSTESGSVVDIDRFIVE
jgi:molecular chaperone DnaK